MKDWVDWLLLAVQILSLIGTGAATMLAYSTIQQAKRQAREAQSALLRERRIDFELGVLKELGTALRKAGCRQEAVLLVRLLPLAELRISRATLGLNSTFEAEELVEANRPKPLSYRGP